MFPVPGLQAPAPLLQWGISEGFATNLETFLAVLWNKEEFLECAQGWSQARKRLSPVMAFFGMLGVCLDTPVLDGQLRPLLLEGWELGICELFQRCKSIPAAAEDEN